LILKKTATKQTNAKAKQVLMGFGVDPVWWMGPCIHETRIL